MYYSTPSVNVNGCTVNITRNRNRAKIYGDSVYLKDGENFEIELFNPTTVRVLAKITINGNSISSSGIVLKPGERVYLERFIDTNNKFVFETYEVENSNESLNAIRNNGLITVDFYQEIFTNNNITLDNNFYFYPTFTTNSIGITGNIGPSGIIGSSSLTSNLDHFNSTFTSFGGTTENNLFVTSSMVNDSIKGSNASNSIETGRIEKGESSSQSFSTTNGNFSYFPGKSISYRLITASQKPVESSEIRSYCTGCGTRIKKASWKFCPSCGEKL